MGVHELWPILEPVKKHVPLQSLSGMTLAVDLSIWVCEAQSVKQMIGVVAKPHLRNLFFRVSSLNLMGVKLVFVTEGEAPKVKADTMNKRNANRYGPSNKPAPSRPGRSYFKSVLKECLRMLDCLGVPWVQAAGEAEAMCAYLNAKGHVDGCITNDGDVFLYGARTVYRNFTMNVKDPHVDCYEVSAINDKLGLDRESLVSLAILLGCDYVPKGLPGIGREMAMKFIRSLTGESVLQRFYQWRKEFDDPTVPPKSAKKTAHCSVCCHPGSAKEHQRKGCSLCASDRYCEPHDYDYCCPCEWHKAEQEKKNNPLEYTFKTKARKREGFPYHEVIQEFLVNKDKLSKVIRWLRPSLPCFQNFALEWMEWPKHYSCEKILVLLTYYDMHERKAGRQHDAQLQATRIVKTRVRNGVPCFEIEWVKPAMFFLMIIHRMLHY
ncbi:PREDICTED: flap endonuclease GEN homolog 1 [Nanorana parkeri]|uniref:flap endonuclease GEN homolog 1 n=1 Tax=Nanorana parkeri TaxID=125878 RepID=UPI000854B57E|nr:PREDICTED: flap endonuclease GEN homolog 1 [Nanorana parkeri]